MGTIQREEDEERVEIELMEVDPYIQTAGDSDLSEAEERIRRREDIAGRGAARAAQQQQAWGAGTSGRQTRSRSRADSLVRYNTLLKVYDESSQTYVHRSLTESIMHDVALFADGYNAVTVVADSLSYVVKGERASDGLATVGSTIRSIVNLPQYFSQSSSVDTTVLRDISFVLKPGETMLVLGPPRSGKSTLLQLLANRRTHGSTTGGLYIDDVKVHGSSQPRNWHRQVVYVDQKDIHLARLTVKETFDLAFELLGPEGFPPEKREDDVLQVLTMLGIIRQKDTLVGDSLLRGISGGERRRVSIGVSLGRLPELLLLDEPSTGLDATTTLSILSRVTLLAEALNLPVITALQQPSYELFSQFDKLLLLDKGRVAFHGPVENALPFFETLGLHCPDTENPADFLPTALVEPSLYFSGKPEDAPTSREISQAYRRSSDYARLEAEINAQVQDDYDADPSSSSDRLPLRGRRRRDILRESYTAKSHKYPVSLFRQTVLLTKRAFLQHYHDPLSVIVTRYVSAIFMGLIWELSFFQLGDSLSDTQSKGGLAFFGITFASFNALGSAMPTLFREREVFLAQRAAKYYPTFPYWVAPIFVEIPILVGEVVLFSVPLYFMAGLSLEPDRYFFFCLVVFLSAQAIGAFTRMIGVYSKELEIAESIGGALVGIFMIFSGFMIQPSRLWEPMLVFIYTSPMYYANQAVLANEFSGKEIACSPGELVPPAWLPNFNATFEEGGYGGTQICPFPTGEALMEAFDVRTEAYWKYVCALVLLLMTVIFQIISFFGLKMQKPSFQASRNPVEQSLMQETAESGDPLPSVMAAKRESETDPTSSFSEAEVTVRMPSAGTPARIGAHSVGQFSDLAEDEGAIPGYLSFQNLSYSVKSGSTEKRLLSNLDGYCKPGFLLALMGPSGAGKSTLLDVLAQRKTGGKTTGTILFNGNPLDNNFTRVSAYVEQTDSHFPTQTVQEAVEFSVQTRTDFSPATQIHLVRRTLAMLDLSPIAHVLIGGGSLGNILSSEQQKRVSIACELVTQPRILFCDEPTSGLDAVGAFKIIRLLKRISNSGVSVICTIHQPSQAVFALFSHMLLLRRGGLPLYFGALGENHAIMFHYFSRLGYEMPRHKNPADFVLDIAMGEANYEDFEKMLEEAKTMENPETVEARQQARLEASLEKLEELVSGWEQSVEKEVVCSELEEGICPQEVLSSARHTSLWTSRYRLNALQQFRILHKRASLGYWRKPELAVAKFFSAVMMTVILGATFWDLPADPQGLNERGSLLYFLCLFGCINAFAMLALVNEERPCYYRERANCCYSSVTYCLAFIASELPYQMSAAAMVTIPVYFMSGLQLDGYIFFKYIFLYIVSSMCSTGICLTAGSLSTSLEMATAFVSLALTIFALTAGYVLSKEEMPTPYLSLYYINFISYSLSGFLINEMSDLAVSCDNGGAIPIPVNSTSGIQIQEFCPFSSGDQYLALLGIETGFWENWAIVLAFYSLFLFLFWFGAKFVVAQTR